MRYSRHHASTPRPAVQDGVNPSDAIAKTHSRKVGAFYWSIMEFGPMALGMEQSFRQQTLYFLLQFCKLFMELLK